MVVDGCRRADERWRDHSMVHACAQARRRRYNRSRRRPPVRSRCRPLEVPLPKESTMNLSRETLLDDFSTMLSEAEDLLKRASNETGERAKDLRAQVEAKLLAAKLRLQELEGEAMD